MVFQLLTQLKELRQTRKKRRADDYSGYVSQIAQGQEPSVEEIDQALETFGVAEDQFAKDVEVKRKRFELAAQEATIPELQRQLTEKEDLYQTEAVAWEIATKRHNEKELPLRMQILGLQQSLAEARSCKGKLRSSYRGELLDQLSEIEKERQRIRIQMQPISATLEHHQLWLRPDSGCSENERQGHAKVVAGCEVQLAELRSMIPDLDRRQAEIEETMNKP